MDEAESFGKGGNGGLTEGSRKNEVWLILWVEELGDMAICNGTGWAWARCFFAGGEMANCMAWTRCWMSVGCAMDMGKERLEDRALSLGLGKTGFSSVESSSRLICRRWSIWTKRPHSIWYCSSEPDRFNLAASCRRYWERRSSRRCLHARSPVGFAKICNQTRSVLRYCTQQIVKYFRRPDAWLNEEDDE